VYSYNSQHVLRDLPGYDRPTSIQAHARSKQFGHVKKKLRDLAGYESLWANNRIQPSYMHARGNNMHQLTDRVQLEKEKNEKRPTLFYKLLVILILSNT
jgi:hypothetical protein